MISIIIALLINIIGPLYIGLHYFPPIVQHLTHITSISQGNGSHCVIMLHGLMGNPKEFENLMVLFDKENYTIYSPMLRKNHVQRINVTAYQTFKKTIKFLIDNKQINRISIIGNSFGGLIAKSMLYYLDMYSTYKNITQENFINVVTPHLPIKGSSPIDYIRWYLCYYLFKNAGKDLLGEYILYKSNDFEFKNYYGDIVKKYKKRISYGLNGGLESYDINVPYYSYTAELNLTSNKSKIAENNIIWHTSEWKFYTIPIFSLFSHGNAVGKHLNNRFVTWNKEQVIQSIKHIRNNFT